MRLHNGFAGQPGLLVGILGLAFSCAQGCANGDTKQDEATGGDGNGVGSGGISSMGGDSGQGGSTTSTAASGGVTSMGGAEVGGSNSGGATETTGGASTSTDAVGGANTGGVVGTGGNTGPELGGQTFGSGGAPPETGGAATGGVPAIECRDSRDCVNAPDGETICSQAGQCVQCVTPDDCGPDGGSNHDCTRNRCIAFEPCNQDDDCSTGACNLARHRCVECTSDTHCTAPNNKCYAQACRVGCASDNSCTPLGMLCNKTTGVCIECDDQMTCDNGLLCDPNGKCVEPVCGAGERICLGGGIATCVANGSGFGTPKACPTGSACEQHGGVLGCYDADGGLACYVPGDPCAEIPAFIGAQVLDGVGDEFCGIPSAVLDATHNQGTRDWHTRAPEVATIQVAWSSVGLHLYVEVEDVSVQTVQMADPAQAITRAYQGDSIEILFSSNNNVTGLTGTDANSLHVQIPASGPAVMIKTNNEGGASQGTATALPQGQYMQKILPGVGYAIEAQLPWPGAAKPNMGTTIRFDLTLNSADTNFSSVDDMRDGALFYHLGNVASSTCQSNDGTVPYCDNRTWCATPLR